jgi:hypothetical protein
MFETVGLRSEGVVSEVAAFEGASDHGKVA